MKAIITGGSGLVATELTLNLLSQYHPIDIILVSRNPKEVDERYRQYGNKVKSFTLDELEKENAGSYDICIHTAFARSSSGDKIVESLIYTERLCQWIKEQRIPRFVNISSQSVYGSSYEPFVDENTPCSPGYMYALAKFSSELLAKDIFINSATEIINLRLSSVCENARFLKVFVENAINNKPTELVAPNQMVSFIDVRDVASAITKIIFAENFVQGNYNLGSGRSYTILEVCELIKDIGTSQYGLSKVVFNINDNGTKTKIGMSIDKFCSTFEWKPSFSIRDMVSSLFEMLTSVNGGGIHNPLG